MKKDHLFFLIIFFLFPIQKIIFSAEGTVEEDAPTPILEKPALDEPWFTGPLLTPSGHIAPIGFINVEPYAFVFVTNGIYDKHWKTVSRPNFYTANFQLPIQIGLTHKWQVQISPQATYNSTQGVSSFELGDFSLELDYQILEDTEENKLPGIKAYINEIFPTGKYQRLKAENLRTDSTGGGSFVTTFGLVVSRLFHLKSYYYINLRVNPFYSISAPTHVRGINTYGGAKDTRGKVYPGNSFGFLYGMEIALSRNWVFAFDTQAFYSNKTRFSGKKGTIDGTPATVGLPSNVQFSLAPAIEYNWNASIGIIAGSWFTIAGRNSQRFISGVVAINYYGPTSEGKVSKPFRLTGGGGGG
ncbi:MAG: hypothetical protein L0207_02075 [Chlamydiae bacterium]|nr:hypothetical protein [Chlamydiota bacterium]